MAHMWVSHVALVSELYHTRGLLIMSHMWTPRLSCVEIWKWVSSQMHKRVVSHIWIIRNTHVSGSCRTYAWVITHILYRRYKYFSKAGSIAIFYGTYDCEPTFEKFSICSDSCRYTSHRRCVKYTFLHIHVQTDINTHKQTNTYTYTL